MRVDEFVIAILTLLIICVSIVWYVKATLFIATALNEVLK